MLHLEKVTFMIYNGISVKLVAERERLGSEKVVQLAESDAVTDRSLLGHVSSSEPSPRSL